MLTSLSFRNHCQEKSLWAAAFVSVEVDFRANYLNKTCLPDGGNK